jgi:hypothetical protein
LSALMIVCRSALRNKDTDPDRAVATLFFSL